MATLDKILAKRKQDLKRKGQQDDGDNQKRWSNRTQASSANQNGDNENQDWQEDEPITFEVVNTETENQEPTHQKTIIAQVWETPQVDEKTEKTVWVEPAKSASWLLVAQSFKAKQEEFPQLGDVEGEQQARERSQQQELKRLEQQRQQERAAALPVPGSVGPQIPKFTGPVQNAPVQNPQETQLTLQQQKMLEMEQRAAAQVHTTQPASIQKSTQPTPVQKAPEVTDVEYKPKFFASSDVEKKTVTAPEDEKLSLQQRKMLEVEHRPVEKVGPHLDRGSIQKQTPETATSTPAEYKPLPFVNSQGKQPVQAKGFELSEQQKKLLAKEEQQPTPSQPSAGHKE